MLNIGMCVRRGCMSTRAVLNIVFEHLTRLRRKSFISTIGRCGYFRWKSWHMEHREAERRTRLSWRNVAAISGMFNSNKFAIKKLRCLVYGLKQGWVRICHQGKHHSLFKIRINIKLGYAVVATEAEF